MRKQEFLAQLRKGLSQLPQDDIEERLTFYSEMIDDRMEEGLSEQDAVRAVGTTEQIAAQIIADVPAEKIVKKRWRVWEIMLLVLGSPLWISLLAAAFAVVLALYASLWAMIISLWAVFGALVGCTVGGVASGILFACSGKAFAGITMVGAGLVCAGLSIFLFFGCKVATGGTLLLTRKVFKKCFQKKETAQ